jgi:hypothetical protein
MLSWPCFFKKSSFQATLPCFFVKKAAFRLRCPCFFVKKAAFRLRCPCFFKKATPVFLKKQLSGYAWPAAGLFC